jgi:DNA-binding beta-propeller fold protein YncE
VTNWEPETLVRFFLSKTHNRLYGTPRQTLQFGCHNPFKGIKRMTRWVHDRLPLSAAGLTLALVVSGALAQAQSQPQPLPNMGQQITPLAPQGSQFQGLNPGLAPPAQDWLASQAVTSVVSPDHKTMLVMTSGYNRFNIGNVQPPTGTNSWDPSLSNEYVFVYDISNSTPVQKHVVQIATTYSGIAFDPSGLAFYVGGCAYDLVHVVTQNAAGVWADQFPQGALLLGHKLGLGLNIVPNGATAVNSQVGVHPCAAGVAVSKDGQTLVAANYYNDSISVFTGGLGHWSPVPGPDPKTPGLDLRPGKSMSNPKPGTPGGEYPYWVVVKGSGSSATAYVSSIRDREIVVVSLGGTPAVTARIPVKGQPNKMTLNAAQSLLYVADDQADTVDVIDTSRNVILETIPVVTPLLPSALAQQGYKGANPNSVTLSPDETQLYVTNGNLNCISVVALSGNNSNDHVVGLIPTGWYPNSVSFSGDGNTVYVINGKSPTGPNPDWCYGGYGPPGEPTCYAANTYNPQLTKAGLQTFPRPSAAQLGTLTQQVATNNRFSSTESDHDKAVMAAVRQGVQHVIFILKENRTYDQILGDLPIGNGDPRLTLFGQAVTPNQHNLAMKFVTLDNFLDTAEVSYDGWLWSTSAQAPDVVQKEWPVAYAYRALGVESEGANRNVNVAIPTVSGRIAADPFTSADPDVLPGQTNMAAPDGPNNEVNTGYLWNSALRANLTVRNYGFFIDGTLYSTTTNAIPVLRNPFSTGTVVANPTDVALTPYTDRFFRGFDNSLPDYWRYMEWERDFDANERRARPTVGGPKFPEGLASLTLVRFMHDHTGNFDVAIDGVNTPDLMVADNDYAVGLLIQKIANSRYADNTLIFVVEDDAQDGGDHVDSHRSIAFVAGAYVKQGALVSTPYNTIDFVRTMEEVLGLPPMNLNDALARPMADIFNTTPSPWSFTAIPSPLLYRTQLPMTPHNRAGLIVPKPAHDAKYWARATKGLDFTDADRVGPEDYNRILWKGMMGNQPYPATPSGLDLRQNREDFLARYRRSFEQKSAHERKKGTD